MPVLYGNVLNASAIIPVGIFAEAPTRALAENPRGKNAYRALIDTGATMSAVTEKVVNDLALKYEGGIFYSGVADGMNQKTTEIYRSYISVPVRKITTNIPQGKQIGDAHLERTSAKVHRELTVAACLAGDKEYDMLLGMDALADYSLVIQYGVFALGYPDRAADSEDVVKELTSSGKS